MRFPAFAALATLLFLAVGLPVRALAAAADGLDLSFPEAIETKINAYVNQTSLESPQTDDALDREAAKILGFSWPIPLPEKKPDEITLMVDQSVKNLVRKKYSEETLAETQKLIMAQFGPVIPGQTVKFRVKGNNNEISGVLNGIQRQNRTGPITAIRVGGNIYLIEDISHSNFLNRLEPAVSMPVAEKKIQEATEQQGRLREKYKQQIRPRIEQALYLHYGYLQLGDKWRAPEEMVVLVAGKIKKLLHNKRKSQGLKVEPKAEEDSGW